MIESSTDKFFNFITTLISHYLVWLVLIFVIGLWFFFPALIATFGQIIVFVAPVLILFAALLVASMKTRYKVKKQEEQGSYQFDIIVTKMHLYTSEFLIYAGTIAILVVAYLFSENQVDVIDLIQALGFFLFASGVKKIFTKNIIK